MDENIMTAYAEVDQIINLMDEELQKMIPKELKKLISENKSLNYNIKIDPNISLSEQKISKKALAILAVLNYNYLCSNEEEKNILIEQYKNNEINEQKKLEEKYSVNNMFKIKTKNTYNNCENTQIVIYNKKESFINRLIYKIKNIFKQIDIKSRK